MALLVLRNALCVSFDPPSVEETDISIEGGAVQARGRNVPAPPGTPVEDLGGRVVMPGLVCAHTHLYSTLARGMPPPPQAPKDFPEMLAMVWWRLDRALDEEAVYYSALVGGLEAVRSGVTAIVDHHASPMAIRGSLSSIERALTEIGVRGILCYETSDRDGSGRRDEGVEENREFIAAHRHHPMIRGLVGAHASFTLSDESLRLLGDIAETYGTGVHVHCAEDRADVLRTRSQYGTSVIPRFEKAGLLRPDSLFVHCVHLDPPEFALLHGARSWLIHNPRSNMNNAVGHAPLAHFGPRGALGTDGFPADMFEELRAAYFRNRESGDPRSPAEIAALLQGGQGILRQIFNRPFGSLGPGAPADLVVLDYNPPTPLSVANLFDHVLFGMRSSMVHSVMVDGTWVVRNREMLRVREKEILQEAGRVAARLWKRMNNVRP